MAEFRMPSLGADMDSGVLLEWLVKPGDAVKRGDIVAVVDTSKAEIEIEVFEDGVVEELLVPVGERAPVGTPIAMIVTGAPAQPAAATAVAVAAGPGGNGATAAAAEAVTELPAPPPPAPVRPPAVEPEHRRRISPVARRTAAVLGVDLESLEGTGPRGAVTKADVERTAAAQPTTPTAPPPAPVVPAPPAATPAADRQAAMRDAIAQLMARSKREVPHYYLAEDVDLSAALAFLERRNLELPVAERLLPAVLIAKATAVALYQVPDLNGFWTDEGFQPGTGVHLGFAVSLRGGGLIAPAIHDADALSLDKLMTSIRDLVRRARAGTLRASEMSDPTVTLTSLGERGAQAVYGVIYPPQVALVGFGRIAERPWAAGGMLAARPVTTVTLSGDHRASDGATGGRLLTAIARNLQTPEQL